MGRPIRKTWGKVIDLQLLKKAAEGDLAAIKVVKEFELRLEAIRARHAPPKTEAEIRAELEEQEKRKQNAARLIDLLDNVKDFKKAGMVAGNDDHHPIDKFHGHGLAAWVYEAMMDYREKLGLPRDPGPWQSWRP